MPIPLLPALKDATSENKIAINKPGEWSDGAQNTLSNLVDSLKVAAGKESNISSIPDVWARPALYEAILVNEKHPLHEHYKQEWRGVLAIIAMRKLRNFSDIKVETVDVPKKEKIKESDPAFLKVIARSIPESFLREGKKDPTTKADCAAKVQILAINGIPLAMMWPSILFCPALNLEMHQVIEVPWWTLDGIGDPLPELSDDEKNAMVAWLTNIINDPSITDNSLMGLLTSYRDDIEASLGDSLNKDYKIAQGASLGITGSCALIDCPIAGSIDDKESFLKKSNVRLVKRKQGVNKDILLMAPDIDQQWNMNPADIIIGGSITAGAVPFRTGVILDSATLNEIDLAQFDTEYRMVDSFFTDKIMVIHLGINAFPNIINNKVLSFNGEKVNVVLPLKKELLDYFDAEYLAKRVHIAMVDGGIQVDLSLPVTGFDDKEKFIMAHKVYQTDTDSDEIVEYGDVPILQVWPNFILNKEENWRTYFTYFDACDVGATFYAQPSWGEDNQPRPVLRNGKNAEIRRGSTFPEAFLCSYQSESNSGMAERHEIGLLLLKKPEPLIVNQATKSCKIGIDFGTTNTIAYMMLGNSKPKPIEFESRMFYVTNNKAPENDDQGLTAIAHSVLRQYFISSKAQPYFANKKEQEANPFIKTMFHTYNGDFDGNIDQTLFRGNIYYLDGATNIQEDSLDNIHTSEMKWGNTEEIDNMVGFLMELCTQALMEAVLQGANRIQWFYSYPTSFTGRQLKMLKNNWVTVMNEMKRLSDVSFDGSVPQTESNSIAEYFISDMKAHPKNGIVCLDIGGGSTDIAVWQGKTGENQKQTSLRFAGRDILNTYLWKKQENGKYIFASLKKANQEFNNLVDELTKIEDKAEFDMKLEVILRYHGTEIFNSLPQVMFKNADIENTIRDISFALGGIFFYSGILIGYLRKTGQYTELRALPDCYVGGNASRLLDWASGGRFTDDDAELFKKCFMAGIDAEEKGAEYKKIFKISKTDRPKQEVAYGLVCDADIKLQSGNDDVISGEHFIVEDSDEPIDTDVITAQEMMQDVQIDDEDLPFFKKFLEVFNKEIKGLYDPINFDEQGLFEVAKQVNQILNDRCTDVTDEDDVVLEPIFIVVLKAAYEYLAEH